MLASSSLHTSATFWTVASVAVAVVAILVTVLLWRLGSPRRLLLYSLTSDTALLSSDARARAADAELQIILAGQVLSDPHFVSLRIESRSRRDIRSEDFSASRPLVFELAVPILKLLDSDTGGEKMPDVKADTDGSRVTVGPGLINRRQVINLDLLTDGAVTLTCPRPSLADVTVREWRDETVEPTWLKWTAFILGIVFVGGLVLNSIGSTHNIAVLVNISIGISVVSALALLGAAVLALAVLTIQNGGVLRRPTTRNPKSARPRNS